MGGLAIWRFGGSKRSGATLLSENGSGATLLSEYGATLLSENGATLLSENECGGGQLKLEELQDRITIGRLKISGNIGGT